MEWHYAHPESLNWSKRGQYHISSGWDGITHILRVQIGQSEVSITLAADGLALQTCWEFEVVKARSVSNQEQMEWYCAPAESSNWSKRGQYRISSRWNSITHILRVQIGQSTVSITLAVDEIALRTSWEFKLVKARSVSNQQRMEWHYGPTESSNWSKRGQSQISGGWNGIAHRLRVQIGQSEVSIKSGADGMVLRTGWEFKLVKARSVSH